MSETQGKLLSEERLKEIRYDLSRNFAGWGYRSEIEKRFNELLDDHDALTLQLAKTRADALEEAAKICDALIDGGSDCDNLGPMDPETGVRECSRDLRGGGCLCAERDETAEAIADVIRALLPPKQEEQL